MFGIGIFQRKIHNAVFLAGSFFWCVSFASFVCVKIISVEIFPGYFRCKNATTLTVWRVYSRSLDSKLFYCKRDEEPNEGDLELCVVELKIIYLFAIVAEMSNSNCYARLFSECTQLEDPRLEWRAIQEAMLRDYLTTAQDVLEVSGTCVKKFYRKY